jgi:peptidoglycan/LPS O-acetylase OafA/YrhL
MKKENDFFDKPGNIRLLKILSYICLAIVVAVDFFISREHAHYPWDYIPGFYAVFGLVACILIVVMAKTLGKKWLMKKEDYYD